MQMTTSVLTVTDARKHFGSTKALDSAGFALQQGECLGLLGPNGAGKTTLASASVIFLAMSMPSAW